MWKCLCRLLLYPMQCDPNNRFLPPFPSCLSCLLICCPFCSVQKSSSRPLSTKCVLRNGTSNGHSNRPFPSLRASSMTASLRMAASRSSLPFCWAFLGMVFPYSMAKSVLLKVQWSHPRMRRSKVPRNGSAIPLKVKRKSPRQCVLCLTALSPSGLSLHWFPNDASRLVFFSCCWGPSVVGTAFTWTTGNTQHNATQYTKH